MPKCGASARRAKRSRRFQSNRPRHSRQAPAPACGAPSPGAEAFCPQTRAQAGAGAGRLPATCQPVGAGALKRPPPRRKPAAGAPWLPRSPAAEPPCVRRCRAPCPSVAATAGEPSHLRAAGRRWPLPLEPRWRRPISGTSGGSAVRGHPMRTAKNIKIASIIATGALLFGACAAQAQSSSQQRPPRQPPRTVIIEREGPPPAPGSVRSTRREPTRISRRRCKAQRRSRRWRHASVADGLACRSASAQRAKRVACAKRVTCAKRHM